MDLEKTLLRKTGEAIHRFRMIREGDRIAVAVSGGKDSVTLLEALLLLQKRAPIDFSVCAFTVEQGKFLAPVEAVGEYIRGLGVAWTYHTDNPRCACSKKSRTTAAISAAVSAGAPFTRLRAASAPT